MTDNAWLHEDEPRLILATSFSNHHIVTRFRGMRIEPDFRFETRIISATNMETIFVYNSYDSAVDGHHRALQLLSRKAIGNGE